ncbi:MAG: CoA protein activase [Peptococcaceae bacterium BICA1-8]|nr:MAG: CoA protein activase [Peptococcaceae bacterium BICA1-8]
MKITFPHMGNLYIPVKGLLEYLNLDVIVPPPSSQKTLNLGVKYGPEFACLPLKLNLGNLIEAREIGADTVIMAGGVGPCRFGLYSQTEKEILNDLGYDYDCLVLEPPDKHLGQFIMRLRKIIGTNSWWRVIDAIKFAYQKAYAVDLVEKKVQHLRPLEKKFGTADSIYRHVLNTINDAQSINSLQEATNLGILKLEQIPQNINSEVIRIGLIGEIYTLLEPFVSFDIEKELGKLGVQVTRSLYLSEWINSHLLMNYYKKEQSKPFAKLAKPYLNYFVGGHGRETIGYAVGFAQEGYHGLIQIAPLTCMPEIIAHTILPRVKENYRIPILTIYVDEQSGKAGFLTRIEAFIDLIKRQQENNKRRIVL